MPQWRGSWASAWALIRSRQAQDFSLNLIFTLGVYASVVVIEKLVVVPYLARHLDEAAFGALLLGRNTTVILSGGLASGVYNLLLRQNREWEGTAKGIAVRSAVVLSLILSVIITALALVALAVHNGPIFLREHVLPIFAFTVWGVANAASYILQTYWRMQFRIPLFSALQFLTGAALIAVVPGYLCFGLTGVYWGLIGAGLIPLLITLVVGYREMKDDHAPLWRLADVREMSKRIWVFVWGTASQSLLQNTERFVIGYLIGAAAVGAYFKATNAAYMVIVPIEPIAGLLLSMAAQERIGRHTLRHLRMLHGLMAVTVAGALLLGLVLGRPMTDLLYGAGTFESGKLQYVIVLAGCSLGIISLLLRGLLVVHVAAARIVWIDTISVLFIAASSFVLTSRFGVTGAAVAMALSMALRAALSEAAIWLTVRQHLRGG